MDVSKVEAASDWIPFLINSLDWEDFLANQELYSRSLPATKEGFYLHHAFGRYQLVAQGRYRDEDAQETDRAKKKKKKADPGEGKKRLILTTKFLKTTINPGLGLLLALDAYQPRETLEVYGEKDRVQEKLGTVISLTEVDQKKKNLGKLIFSLDKKQTLEIRPGEIILLQAGKDQELSIDFRLGGAQVLGKRRAKVLVSGGQVGVVIDARGRPIEIEEGEEGWRQVKRWMKVFGG